MKDIKYNRNKALEYAHRWAYKRNPKYLDFHNLGGDCTNFASQVIFAGSGIMNYTPNTGWYYVNSNRRSPSWTDVDLLYRFLINNQGVGPFAEKVDMDKIVPGDLIQLAFTQNKNDFNHSLIVVSVGNPIEPSNILIATHTYDKDYYPLSNYGWTDIRFLHIKGVRKL